jgi:hypothetical protein
MFFSPQLIKAVSPSLRFCVASRMFCYLAGVALKVVEITESWPSVNCTVTLIGVQHNKLAL